MAEPFYGVGQTPGLPEVDPSEAARKKAILDYFMKEQSENFGAIPRALGAAFSMPQRRRGVPGDRRAPGLLVLKAPPSAYGRTSELDAIENEYNRKVEQLVLKAPPSAYGRTSELDAIENEYNRKVEHPDLGFAWGGGPIKPYGQDSSTRSGKFGEAPTQGAGFGQTWDVPAKGGAFSQSDIEQIPMGQRPASWFEDQMAGTDLAKMAAEKARAEAEAEDPYMRERIAYMRERIAADAQVRGKMISGQQENDQIRAYYESAAKVETQRQAAMAELQSHPGFARLTPAEQEMERAKVNSQFDREADLLDFAFHGRTRTKASGLF